MLPLVTSLDQTLSMSSSVLVFHGSLLQYMKVLKMAKITLFQLVVSVSVSSFSVFAPLSVLFAYSLEDTRLAVSLEEAKTVDLDLPSSSSVCGSSTSQCPFCKHMRLEVKMPGKD